MKQYNFVCELGRYYVLHFGIGTSTLETIYEIANENSLTKVSTKNKLQYKKRFIRRENPGYLDLQLLKIEE